MKIFLSITLALLVLMQFIKVELKNVPIDKNIALKAPKHIEKILQKSCNDCHTNKTNFPFYAYIAPFSWSIASHVNTGRKVLNFSEWKKIPKDMKIKRLKRISTLLEMDIMPLPSYTWIHRNAKLTKEEKKELIAFFKKITPKP
jgi:hypothetical protein